MAIEKLISSQQHDIFKAVSLWWKSNPYLAFAGNNKGLCGASHPSFTKSIMIACFNKNSRHYFPNITYYNS
jgi:hypothetical protein